MSARDELAAIVRPIVERCYIGHCWRKTSDGPRHIKERFSETLLSEHVMGGNAYGLCPIAPGTSATRVAVLDLDSHKGATDWTEMRRVADLIAVALEMDGYAPTLFRSSGGKGIHIYLIWDEPQDAYSVRGMLRGVLAACGFANGTAGVAEGEIEIFPKQDSVAPDGAGSMFILPLSGKSEALGPVTWPLSPNVPVLQKPPQPERVATDAPELARLKSALDAIPNGPTDSLSYQDWHRVVCAVDHATGSSDEGRALVVEFSARSPKFDETFFSERVWGYLNSDRQGPVITERTLFGMAEQNGWLDPDIANDFEIVDEIQQTENNLKRFEFIDDIAFSAGKPPSWLIRDVLPQAELGVIFGASGSGKSFFALDLAGAISRGLDWRGKKTTQGRVGYIAAEGASGFRNRIKAYCTQHEIDTMGIKVLAAAPNLMEAKDVIDLGNAMRAAGPLDIVFVDTLAQVTPGANENAGEDMGRVIGHCGTLHTVTGAMIVLIHHSGKDAARGARGWSGIKGALNVEIEIVRSDNDRCATVSKMKDGTGEGDEYGFKLRTVPVGMDDDGEVISSCTLEYTQGNGKGVRQSEIKGEVEKVVWQAVCDLVGPGGDLPTANDVIDAAVGHLVHDTTKRDTRRQRVMRALDVLGSKGRLLIADGRVGLPEGNE